MPWYLFLQQKIFFCGTIPERLRFCIPTRFALLSSLQLTAVLQDWHMSPSDSSWTLSQYPLASLIIAQDSQTWISLLATSVHSFSQPASSYLYTHSHFTFIFISRVYSHSLSIHLINLLHFSISKHTFFTSTILSLTLIYISVNFLRQL